eukprot:m51a1_g12361 hypothetical protein (815) ;mRNA; f:571566-575969
MAPSLGRRVRRVCAYATALAELAFLAVAALSLLRAFPVALVARDPNRCAMTWMRPHYAPVALAGAPAASAARGYAVHLYLEGGRGAPRPGAAVPALFVPGNAGSHKQVRSIASEAARLALPLDFYAADFNEELSALDGESLWEQSRFVAAAARELSERYRSPIVLVGHSMGGVVARASIVLSMASSTPLNVSLLMSLSSPHLEPVLAPDAHITRLYALIAAHEGNLSVVPHVSVAGGWADTLVSPRLVRTSHGVCASTEAIAGVWVQADHQCICWCNQFVAVATRALGAAAVLPTASARSAELLDRFAHSPRDALLNGVKALPRSAPREARDPVRVSEAGLFVRSPPVSTVYSVRLDREMLRAGVVVFDAEGAVRAWLLRSDGATSNLLAAEPVMSPFAPLDSVPHPAAFVVVGMPSADEKWEELVVEVARTPEHLAIGSFLSLQNAIEVAAPRSPLSPREVIMPSSSTVFIARVNVSLWAPHTPLRLEVSSGAGSYATLFYTSSPEPAMGQSSQSGDPATGVLRHVLMSHSDAVDSAEVFVLVVGKGRSSSVRITLDADPILALSQTWRNFGARVVGVVLLLAIASATSKVVSASRVVILAALPILVTFAFFPVVFDRFDTRPAGGIAYKDYAVIGVLGVCLHYAVVMTTVVLRVVIGIVLSVGKLLPVEVAKRFGFGVAAVVALMSACFKLQSGLCAAAALVFLLAYASVTAKSKQSRTSLFVVLLLPTCFSLLPLVARKPLRINKVGLDGSESWAAVVVAEVLVSTVLRDKVPRWIRGLCVPVFTIVSACYIPASLWNDSILHWSRLRFPI